MPEIKLKPRLIGKLKFSVKPLILYDQAVNIKVRQPKKFYK